MPKASEVRTDAQVKFTKMVRRLLMDVLRTEDEPNVTHSGTISHKGYRAEISSAHPPDAKKRRIVIVVEEP